MHKNPKFIFYAIVLALAYLWSEGSYSWGYQSMAANDPYESGQEVFQKLAQSGDLDGSIWVNSINYLAAYLMAFMVDYGLYARLLCASLAILLCVWTVPAGLRIVFVVVSSMGLKRDKRFKTGYKKNQTREGAVKSALDLTSWASIPMSVAFPAYIKLLLFILLQVFILYGFSLGAFFAAFFGTLFAIIAIPIVLFVSLLAGFFHLVDNSGMA